jgi:exo-1,4-beta-D-glucosaminidase
MRLVKGKENEEIFPVFWQDNYICLLPGEKREVTVSVQKEDLDSVKPVLLVDGFNVAQSSVHEGRK